MLYFHTSLEAREGEGKVWYARVLRDMARQLRVSNDFYYPLLDAAKLIEEAYANEPIRPL